MGVRAAAVALALTALPLAGCSGGSAFDVTVGDCFNTPSVDEDGVLGGVDVISCSQPHDSELYFEYDLTLPAYDEAAITADIQNRCLEEFLVYVGVTWLESDYNYYALSPTVERWGMGDRKVSCALKSRDGKSSGSAQGSGG